MNSIVMISPGVTGAVEVSQPVAPPPVVLFGLHQMSWSKKPVPTSSVSPPGQVDVLGTAPTPHPVGEFGVQRSKKPLLTLTGFFCASNDTLSGAPPLNAVDVR